MNNVATKVNIKANFTTNVKKLIGKKPTTKKGKVVKATKRIAYTAVLTALATIFNIITFFPVRYCSLSFTAIPCFIAGVVLGPISGFGVGFLGDLLGHLILPQGAYMPLIGISSGLMGFIPGVLFLLFNGKDYLKICISFLICLVICTIFLNTYNLWLVYSKGTKSFWMYLQLRLPFQILISVVNCFLTCIIYRELAKAGIVKLATRKNKNTELSTAE